MITVATPPYAGRIRFGQYSDGATAIEIHEDEPVCRATVSLEDLDAPPIEPHQVWIKTWGENEGVLDALIAAGVVTLANAPPFIVNQWGAHAILCDLTPAAIEELQRQGGP